MTRGQRQAWHRALAHRGGDGALPSGEAIACAHGRQERWGRLVKNAGQADALGTEHAQLPGLAADEGRDGSRPGKDNLRTNIWPIGEMWPVESLLTALRELSQGETAAAAKPAQASRGAARQIDILLERLPVSGYFSIFQNRHANGSSYRFGRQQNGQLADAWGWADLY